VVPLRGLEGRALSRPEDARLRARETGRRRRHGGLRRKAHPEPLPSLADRGISRILCAPPLQRQASLGTINAATMRLCRADPLASGAIRSRLEAAPMGFLRILEPTARRGGWPDPRSQQIGSCIMRAKQGSSTGSSAPPMEVTGAKRAPKKEDPHRVRPLGATQRGENRYIECLMAK
jgi:hypothetical protein